MCIPSNLHYTEHTAGVCMCEYFWVPKPNALKLRDCHHCQGYDTSSAENIKQIDKEMDVAELDGNALNSICSVM